MPKKIGRGLLNRAINALPIELHIPGYQFCGPGTRLNERLARGDRGINPLDSACRDHDIAYLRSNNLAERHVADNILANKALRRIIDKDSSFGEKAAATTVWAAMKAKTKLGMGLNVARKKTSKKTMKKRTLPIAKRGGVIPLLPLLGVIGSLAGGAAGIAKAVNDKKASQRQLEEMKRYNHAMEGRGVYLAPYKRGGGVRKNNKNKKGKKNADKALKIPKGVTTDVQLRQLAKHMHIPYFRGVFMRNTLPVGGVYQNESGIVNLDNVEGSGTHWVAYAKRGDRAMYFDSFGNLRPPQELAQYLGNNVTQIAYNRLSYQRYNQNNCGQLCLQFLQTIDAQFKDKHHAM